MARQIQPAEWDSEVVQSSVPVLVDVFGTYCAPCRALAPTIEKLATEFEGRAKVVKLDVESDPELAGKLHLSAVPTVLVYRSGKEVGRLVGLRSEGAYRELLGV